MMGFPLGATFVGPWATLGESAIREGTGLRCCAIDLDGHSKSFLAPAERGNGEKRHSGPADVGERSIAGSEKWRCKDITPTGTCSQSLIAGVRQAVAPAPDVCLCLGITSLVSSPLRAYHPSRPRPVYICTLSTICFASPALAGLHWPRGAFFNSVPSFYLLGTRRGPSHICDDCDFGPPIPASCFRPSTYPFQQKRPPSFSTATRQA